MIQMFQIFDDSSDDEIIKMFASMDDHDLTKFNVRYIRQR